MTTNGVFFSVANGAAAAARKTGRQRTRRAGGRSECYMRIGTQKPQKLFAPFASAPQTNEQKLGLYDI